MKKNCARLYFWRSLVMVSLLLSFNQLATAAVIAGNPKGTVTLVEYFDYQCPYCHAMAKVINQLAQNNPDLRVVYRVVPFINPDSRWMASIALAACKQKACGPFHQAMMSLPVKATANQVFNLASVMGLNIEQLQQDAQNLSVAIQITQNMAAFKDLQNDGVPVLLLGRTTEPRPQFHLTGEISESVLKHAIDQLK